MFQSSSILSSKDAAAQQSNCNALRFTSTVIITILNSLLAFVVFTYPDPLAAQLGGETFEEVLTKHPEEPWRLKADEVSYDQKADLYIAQGNVEISKADKKLTADYVRFDHKTMRAYAQGNVMLASGQDVLKGSRMDIDLQNQVGTVENGYIFLKENNYHIKGDKIQKTGENTYEIDKATITTCDGEKPDWKITGRNVKVYEDGHGTAKHATLRAKNVPFLYTPYFYYPARSERQTGFLIPEFGSSDRKGTAYNQPFFWAISDSQDATFYAYYMSKRGLKGAAEYRYVLSETAKGAIMLDGMDDTKVDDGIGDSSDLYGFEDPGVQFLRTNHDRWWFRMSHHQKVPWDFNAKLDLDLVSDQDYLREFKSGYMGFEDTRRYFEKHFNRALDDYNDPIRLNRLNFNRIWQKWSLNAEARYFWDSTQENSDLPDTTISRLPVIGVQGLKQRILTSPFYFNLNSSYNYFWRHSGLTGQRIDVHPRLYWPYRFQKYFTFEPSVGARETSYYLDNPSSSDNQGIDNWEHRELFDIRLNLFSEIYKVFNINGETIDKIKHSVRPQIIYEFIPNVDQDDLPEFDEIDRIDKLSRITYSLTNTLTSKSIKGARTTVIRREDITPGDLIDPPTDYRYNRGGFIDDPSSYSYDDFLRFRLEQSCDLDRSKRAFSPIFAKLDVFPKKYITIDAEAGWSVYDSSFVSRNIATTIWDTRGDRLYVDYRFDKGSEDIDEELGFEKTESISTGATVKVTDRFTVFGDYERNFVDDAEIRRSLGFLYAAPCWSVNFRYVQRPNDVKYEFRIDLRGLGGINF